MIDSRFLIAAITDTLGGNPVLSRLSAKDMLIVSSAAVAVGILLFVIVALVRKDSHGDRHTFVKPVRHEKPSGEMPNGSERRRVRRRRRIQIREHRPRNPTLQETGGLPPQRPEDQPPSY